MFRLLAYVLLISAVSTILSIKVSADEVNLFMPINSTADSTVKSGFVKIGNAEIYYEEQGSGTPLLLLHGGGVDCTMWDLQFNEFSKHFRVIRYDARNYGKSTTGDGPYANHEDLAALLDALKIDKAVVLGLSMGGGIAIDFAVEHPERMLALVSVGAGINGAEFEDPDYEKNRIKEQEALKKGDLYEFIEWIIRSWGDGPKRTPEQMNSDVRKKIHYMMWVTYSKFNPKARPQALKHTADKRLHEIKCPTLSITGKLDMSVIHRLSDMLVQQAPNAKHVSVKNVAHYVNMEAPAEFNRIIIEFLKSSLGK